MPLFQAVRRVKAWPVRDPIRDARECPDCGAAVYGSKGQEAHHAYHERMLDWQEWAEEVVRRLAPRAGMRLEDTEAAGGETDALDEQDDEQHDAKRRMVPWRQLVTRTEDEDYDERLTRKARRVIGGEGEE